MACNAASTPLYTKHIVLSDLLHLVISTAGASLRYEPPSISFAGANDQTPSTEVVVLIVSSSFSRLEQAGVLQGRTGLDQRRLSVCPSSLSLAGHLHHHFLPLSNKVLLGFCTLHEQDSNA